MIAFLEGVSTGDFLILLLVVLAIIAILSYIVKH